MVLSCFCRMFCSINVQVEKVLVFKILRFILESGSLYRCIILLLYSTGVYIFYRIEPEYSPYVPIKCKLFS